MTIELNHTIVWSRDKRASSDFLTTLFGLPNPVAWGPFLTVEVTNRVTLDYHDTDGEVDSQHYCFLVSEGESRNLAVTNLRLASALAPVNQPLRFEVSVANFGPDEARDISVSLATDADAPSDEQTLPPLAPGGGAPDPVSVPVGKCWRPGEARACRPAGRASFRR